MALSSPPFLLATVLFYSCFELWRFPEEFQVSLLFFDLALRVFKEPIQEIMSVSFF